MTVRPYLAPVGAALLALVVVLAIVWSPAAADRRLSAADASARLAHGEITLIDVRSPEEWRETGVARDAQLATIHDPRGMAGFLEAVLGVVAGDRGRPIAVICAAGVRSARARRFLEAHGFTAVFDVSEGMLGRGDEPGWLARGLPIEPCRQC